MTTPSSSRLVVISTRGLSPSGPPGGTIRSPDSRDLTSFFGRQGLGLTPRCQNRMLTTLSRFFAAVDRPAVFGRLAGRVHSAVGRSANVDQNGIGRILGKLHCSGCFLSHGRGPILAVARPVRDLISASPTILRRIYLSFCTDHVTRLVSPSCLGRPTGLQRFRQLARNA